MYALGVVDVLFDKNGYDETNIATPRMISFDN